MARWQTSFFKFGPVAETVGPPCTKVNRFWQESNMNKKVGSMDQMSVTVIYNRLDLHPMAAIVGSERAARMLGSERDEHLLLTEES